MGMFQQNLAKTGSGPDLGSWSGSPTPGLGYFQAFARTNATGLTVVSLCARTRNSLESEAAVLLGMHTFRPSGAAAGPQSVCTQSSHLRSPLVSVLPTLWLSDLFIFPRPMGVK